MRKRILLSILISFILGMFITIFIGIGLEKIKAKKNYLKRRQVAWRNLINALEAKVRNFKGETGLLIKDLETGWEIGFNEKEFFPAASLIKLPILISCFYAEKEGRLNFNEVLRLKNSDKTLGSGILKSMPSGKELTIEELIELMIKISDNTATNILIEKLGFDYLNDCFKKMGLKDTNIVRKMMDFRYRKKGIDNFTTAKDIGYLLEKIYRKDWLNGKVSQKCLELLFSQRYRDRIPKRLPKDVKVAHKTGLERRICHDAGIVFGNKGVFIIVVLTKSGDIKKAKDFISDISLLVYNYYLHF